MLFQAPNAGFAARKSKLLHEILFQLEYRVLVGYIEAVIPLMYASYLSILVCTPSAKYYPQSRSLSADQLQTTIRCILIYATSEILSLVWFHGIVKHKLGFSLLFNLAFVLETEVEQIQSRLFVWIILLLQLPLEHFDFSFRFEWITNR
ncbi:Hypothetical protein PHPALM_3101 [Phytophthora palmivora]|uniref:Transmembrane protein n=1 Tax=Phytophthora palmivora TaxID=4796 RepID=A0A2P4YN81_9STRA|nr:Hypothetical protein PHPALM_3101 [Phytophthora palmivora]